MSSRDSESPPTLCLRSTLCVSTLYLYSVSLDSPQLQRQKEEDRMPPRGGKFSKPSRGGTYLYPSSISIIRTNQYQAGNTSVATCCPATRTGTPLVYGGYVQVYHVNVKLVYLYTCFIYTCQLQMNPTISNYGCCCCCCCCCVGPRRRPLQPRRILRGLLRLRLRLLQRR